MLCDTAEDTDDYNKLDGGYRLYTFPLKPVENTTVSLYSLKMGEFHQLTNSKESSCVSNDSYFSVMLANISTFENNEGKQRDQDDKDELKRANRGKDKCKVIVCTS